MSDWIGYRAWYNAHASVTMRLPRLKPLAERMFLREDDIVEEGGERKEGGGGC
jgi:hypothetical protein